MSTKRFLVFAGDTNYAYGGGWRDFVASATTLAGAQKIVMDTPRDWYHIVDTFTSKIVASRADAVSHKVPL